MNAQFRGAERYIATEELRAAVNAAIVLSRPLRVRRHIGSIGLTRELLDGRTGSVGGAQR